MKLKPFIQRAILFGSAALFLNYASIPFGCWLHQKEVKKIEDKRIKEVCKVEDYLPRIKKVESNDAFFYLQAANAITHKFLSTPESLKIRKDPIHKKYEGKLRGKLEEKAAFEGVADCAYYSIFTFSNFNHICDKLGKPELKDKVRYCEGYYGDDYHAWIQVKVDGEWINYDTTWDIISEKDRIDFNEPNFIIGPQGDSDVIYFIDSKGKQLRGKIYFKNVLKGKSNLVKKIKEDFFL